MSKRGKFGKQAARGRRTFGNNLYRALSGLNLAALPDDEPVIPRPAAETIPEKVTRLRAHLEIHKNDAAARLRYEELTGLSLLSRETLLTPVGREPELTGFGGGRWGSCEVYISGDAIETQLAEEDWQILAQAAGFGALGQ